MVPPEKMAGVTRGLNEAFGVAEFDEIRDLTERPGSNRAFRISCEELHTCCGSTRAGEMALGAAAFDVVPHHSLLARCCTIVRERL